VVEKIESEETHFVSGDFELSLKIRDFFCVLYFLGGGGFSTTWLQKQEYENKELEISEGRI
jgi:hypothetical protein